MQVSRYIRSILLFGTFYILQSCKTAQNSKKEAHLVPENLKEYFRYKAGNPKLISVHRGGGEMPGLPENCLDSFEWISMQMPCIIECDVQMTKDSVLVMMHDETLDRTSNGHGKISDKTYAELQSLKLRDNFGTMTEYPIPKLDEILKWGKGKVVYTLDVKKNVPYKKVIERVNALKAEEYAIMITYNANQAFEIYHIDPTLLISVGIMQESDYFRLMEGGIPDENMIAFIGTREPKKELIDFIHSKGIVTILGTLGNLDKQAAANNDLNYEKWAQTGADIFATDRPLEVYKKLKEFSKK